MRPSTLMNIAKVQGELAADGIHLNQQENQWHTFTFAKALIGSSKIQQFTHERNGSGVQGDQLICNRIFFFFKQLVLLKTGGLQQMRSPRKTINVSACLD